LVKQNILVGGTYYYIEASGKRPGQKAVLFTAPIKLSPQHLFCFQFWYEAKKWWWYQL